LGDAEGRGRGVATRALVLFSTWSFHAIGLQELSLLVHRDNIASRQVALHAGYRRDPGRDKSQEVKGAIWPMLGFALSGPAPNRPDPPRRSATRAAAEREANELDDAHADRPAQPLEIEPAAATSPAADVLLAAGVEQGNDALAAFGQESGRCHRAVLFVVPDLYGAGRERGQTFVRQCDRDASA
jgi:hypothetical protein